MRNNELSLIALSFITLLLIFNYTNSSSSSFPVTTNCMNLYFFTNCTSAATVSMDSLGNASVTYAGNLIVQAGKITSYGASKGAGLSGSLSMTTGIQEAINFMNAKGGGLVDVIQGTYLCKGTQGPYYGGQNVCVLLKSGVSLKFELGATFKQDNNVNANELIANPAALQITALDNDITLDVQGMLDVNIQNQVNSYSTTQLPFGEGTVLSMVHGLTVPHFNIKNFGTYGGLVIGGTDNIPAIVGSVQGEVSQKTTNGGSAPVMWLTTPSHQSILDSVTGYKTDGLITFEDFTTATVNNVVGNALTGTGLFYANPRQTSVGSVHISFAGSIPDSTYGILYDQQNIASSRGQHIGSAYIEYAGESGVLLRSSGATSVTDISFTIDSLFTKDNGQYSAISYSNGLAIGAYVANVMIGYVRAFDDQLVKTQSAGIWFDNPSTNVNIVINSGDLTGNKNVPVNWGIGSGIGSGITFRNVVGYPLMINSSLAELVKMMSDGNYWIFVTEEKSGEKNISFGWFD